MLEGALTGAVIGGVVGLVYVLINKAKKPDQDGAASDKDPEV